MEPTIFTQSVVCVAYPFEMPTPPPTAPQASVVTVRQIVQYWRDTEAKKYTSRSFAMKDYYAALLAADLGDRLAESLTVADILAWYQTSPSERHAEARGLRKRQRAWSPGTKKNVARTIIHLFHLAEAHGLIERHRLKALVGHFEDGDQIRAISEEEYLAMLAAGTDDRWRHLLEFMRETAARPGEAQSLRWPMIDWEGGFVLIRDHKTAKKTKKPRIIPLSDRAVELLCQLEARAPDPNGYVFTNEVGTRWSSQCLTKRLETIRRRTGLGRDVHLHGIRKLALSHWASRGMPIKLASVIAGHSDTKITEAVYTKFDNYVPQLRGAMRDYR